MIPSVGVRTGDIMSLRWSRLLTVSVAILCLGLFASSSNAQDTDPALVAAAKSGDITTLGQLLGKGTDPETRDKDGISALEWACGSGHLDAVKALVDAHAAVDGAYNADKFTPLMRAARFGHPEIAAFLIASGADVNAQASQGRTALGFAVMAKHRDIAELLKKGGAKPSPAEAGQKRALDLCKISKKANFYTEDLSYGASEKAPAVFTCENVKHDFAGEGEVLMYTYIVEGTYAKPTRLWIRTQTFVGSMPKDTIGQTLQPLLAAIAAKLAKGPVPADLAGNVSAMSEFKQDTPMGSVTATFTPGEHADRPNNGAEYRIEIDLH